MAGTSSVLVENMTFRYGRQHEPVFRGFSWTVDCGEAWAVIGPSGCGKSTLLYLLAGLRQPTQGKLLVDGDPVPRPRASTGLILQNHGLLPWATVRENAALGLRIGQFYAHKQSTEELPRPYPPLLPLSEADQWLERLELAHLADKYPAQLSGGQQQRVAIARTLALHPSLLLMDEPFSALDAYTREGLQSLTADLQQELGVTTVIVTHNIEEAAFLGRRVLVLGTLPNEDCTTIDNPEAGRAGWRSSPGFLQVTQALREGLARRPTPEGGRP